MVMTEAERAARNEAVIAAMLARTEKAIAARADVVAERFGLTRHTVVRIWKAGTTVKTPPKKKPTKKKPPMITTAPKTPMPPIIRAAPKTPKPPPIATAPKTPIFILPKGVYTAVAPIGLVAAKARPIQPPVVINNGPLQASVSKKRVLVLAASNRVIESAVERPSIDHMAVPPHNSDTRLSPIDQLPNNNDDSVVLPSDSNNDELLPSYDGGNDKLSRSYDGDNERLPDFTADCNCVLLPRPPSPPKPPPHGSTENSMATATAANQINETSTAHQSNHSHDESATNNEAVRPPAASLTHKSIKSSAKVTILDNSEGLVLDNDKMPTLNDEDDPNFFALSYNHVAQLVVVDHERARLECDDMRTKLQTLRSQFVAVIQSRRDQDDDETTSPESAIEADKLFRPIDVTDPSLPPAPSWSATGPSSWNALGSFMDQVVQQTKSLHRKRAPLKEECRRLQETWVQFQSDHDLWQAECHQTERPSRRKRFKV